VTRSVPSSLGLLFGLWASVFSISVFAGCGQSETPRDSGTDIAKLDPDFAAKTCGNGTLDNGELCDVAITSGEGVCPDKCDDGDACTSDRVIGIACQRRCEFDPITTCSQTGDGCCPSVCDETNDADCKAASKCGNGQLDDSERCDTAIPEGLSGSCPTICDDGNACTKERLVGSGCQTFCEVSSEVTCSGATKDGCCPTGCNSTVDADCSVSCGNGVIERGETCDTAIAAGQPGACPQSCDDKIACTEDALVGAGCNVSCTHTPIQTCD
jgi:hypothetical protein